MVPVLRQGPTGPPTTPQAVVRGLTRQERCLKTVGYLHRLADALELQEGRPRCHLTGTTRRDLLEGAEVLDGRTPRPRLTERVVWYARSLGVEPRELVRGLRHEELVVEVEPVECKLCWTSGCTAWRSCWWTCARLGRRRIGKGIVCSRCVEVFA